jgi:SAM-dependent methyltransferase
MRSARDSESHFNYSFSLSRDVFSPSIAPSGRLGLAFSSMPDIRGLRVLDVGCGGGVIAGLMALNGASRVVGIDINPNAIEDARLNSKHLKIEEKVDFRLGDLLSPLRKDEFFDVIYADLPFTEGTPGDMLERAFFDPGLISIRRLIESVPNINGLRESRIILGVDHNHISLIRSIAADNNFDCHDFLLIDLPWISLYLLELKIAK